MVRDSTVCAICSLYSPSSPLPNTTPPLHHYPPPPLTHTPSPGAANLDVIQEVEYIKEEDKLAYLLDCLQKTAPPVLIFAENKRDVDAIHEFLLLQV